MAFHFRSGLIALALFLVPASSAWANLPIGAPPTTIDFDSFDGSGFVSAPGAGQLDSDEWVVRGVNDGDLPFGGDGSSGDYARGASTGGEAEGGVWAFDHGASVGLGTNLTMDDFTPGWLVLRLLNNTGQTITSVDVEYTMWWNNNGNRSDTTGFSYSTDDVAYTVEGPLTFTTATNADGAGWVSADQSMTIEAVSIDDGESLYLRWDFTLAAGSGDHDEFALDDIVITVLDICGNGIDEAGEGCDDGNADNSDACVAGCLAATCGDGFIRTGVEGCDDGNDDNTDNCPDGAGGTCQPASCGDSFVQAGVEDCEDGNKDNNDACVAGCLTASCGDGFIQTGVEVCDDGNMTNSDACPDGAAGTCADAVCGDGFTYDGMEECDDGDDDDTDACGNDCMSNAPPTTSGETDTDSTTLATDVTGPDTDDTGTTTTEDPTGEPPVTTTGMTTMPTSTSGASTTATTDGGTGDTDGAFEGEDPPGCGCRSGSGGAWLLPAIVLLALPRRRHPAGTKPVSQP